MLDAKAFAEVFNDIKTYPTLKEVGDALGIAAKTVKNKASIYRRRKAMGEKDIPEIINRGGNSGRVVTRDKGDTLKTEPLFDPDEPIETLIKRAIEHNERQAEFWNEKECVDITVECDGPIGICGIPDPHLDNPGTLLRTAFEQADVIANTQGLYAVGIGDWIDNFIVGRLERERRGNVMTNSDSWRVFEHYVSTLSNSLIAFLSGNHMDWTHSAGGVDVAHRICSELGIDPIYDQDEVRVRLNLPCGAQFTHMARHQFPGHSKYNPVHGILVWILERWQGEDVFWGGHIHTGGHVEMERFYEGNRRLVHGIQLASYKMIDKYARQRGFRRNVPFICPVIIHDPATMKTHYISDFDEGVNYLKSLRKRHKKAA